MDHAPSLTGPERLKVSTLPNQATETKNKFNLPEGMETEEANITRNKRKITPIHYNKLQQLQQNTQPNSYTVCNIIAEGFRFIYLAFWFR